MSQYEFSTEIVSLPSQGKCYPETNPLSSGNIELKYMTAREEEILSSQSLIKKGVVLDKLFEAIIVDKKVNPDDILLGDKNAIMLATRILGYGPEYKIEILDDILIHNVPNIIKIDVEGFETNVINGAHKILSNESLKAIIIELNGSGSLYGFDDDLLHSKILSFGFKCFSYEPYQRVLKKIDKYGEYNTIYIRDFNFVKDRIMSSPQIKILNKSI